MINQDDETCNGCLMQTVVDGANGEIPDCYATKCPASTMLCFMNEENNEDEAKMVKCFMDAEGVDDECESCMMYNGGDHSGDGSG